LDHVP